MEDLDKLISKMKQYGATPEILDNYYIGYSIPQIGKEFDLLRFDKNTTINIEIKRTSTEEKISKQLIRNQYYLRFLPQKTLHLFSYVCDTDKLYLLKDNGLEECDFDRLIEALEKQGYIEIPNIDAMFDPTNYLVSPFNSTDRFMESQYFLTRNQEEIKAKVVQSISNKEKYIAVTGKPGTGKTLLLYDLVHDFMDEGNKVLILHCASLNYGQSILIKSYGWDISCSKYISTINLDNYDLIVVDEAQRIWPIQLDKLTERLSNCHCTCIFSFDGTQCMSNDEISWQQADRIISLCGKNIYKLSTKVRTNREVAEFISRLLNKRHPPSVYRYPNVSVSFCGTPVEARNRLLMLQNIGWTVPKYTPSLYVSFDYESYGFGSHSAHEVIGQEFDNIVAVIDKNFKYSENGVLFSESDRHIYSQYKMFYQIITRTRKRLHILVIGNTDIFRYCLSVLK